MKRILFFAIVLLSAVACKNENSKETTLEEAPIVEENQPELYKSTKYPLDVTALFEAHGGMRQWYGMNNMCYEIEGRNGKETHTVSLKDRRVRIENSKWSIGYDGSDVWVLQNEPEVYKGNARFYHNLMFYFYAMPFVLGDDGIQYESVGPTVLDGESYNGIKVSYGDGVGDSPKDEYIAYFDANHKMAWLGYTVTYRDNEKSDRWSYIKYGEWQEISELLLPKKLTWYTVEDGKPTDARNSMDFEKVVVTGSILDDNVFEKPGGATISPR